MEVSVENTGGLARRMTVQVPAERVDQEVTSRLQSMMRTVRLDGFRPGKVPMKVLQQKFGQQVRLEVIDQVVNSTIQEAFTRESIRPAGDPSIEPKVSRPGEPLEYVATFEVFPELEGDIQYTFKVTRPVIEIGAADVDGMLDNLRQQRVTWKQVERAAADGDQVTVDFEGTIDGQPFAGNQASNIPIVIGAGSMIPGFEEQLAGVSAGDEKDIEVTFPDDYPSAEVAGKTARFSIKVNAVAESELPELNDEFAAAFGVATGGMDALRAEVTGNMERELKGLIASRLKSEVFDGLLESNPVEVPAGLVQNEVREMQANDQYRQRDEATLAAAAERRVKLGVVVSEVARRNQIQLDPERVRVMVETIASSYEKPEEVVQWYYGNQDKLAGVQSAVIEDQVVEWVVEHSGVSVKDEKMTFSEIVEEAKKSQG
ncbi:MAG: trigger factor [Gammaproteobacteria bacterium]|nr:trigger factor [Gammaproteobacteria bacterium]